MKNVVYGIIAKMEKDFNENLNVPKAKVLREKKSGEILKISSILFKKIPDPQTETKAKISEIKKDIENNNLDNSQLIEKVNSLNKNLYDINIYNLKKENIINNEYKYINEFNPIIGSAIISQTLSHEINRLSNQIESSSKYIRRLCQDNSEICTYIDIIDTNCFYLSRYASLLDINSRTKRRKYETFLIEDYVKSILLDNPIFYYKGNNYKYIIDGEDFLVRGIKSNVKIIIENMVLNSLYWLEYFKITNPVITLVFLPTCRKLIFYDNGIGIDKKISDKIFEPFVSNKPENDGRGMGLYIVSELLKDFGAMVSLSEEKNIYGNKYKFIIEFLED